MSNHLPLATAGLSFLNRRTWDRSVRTVDAAIPLPRTEQNVTTLAVIKPLACICGHRLCRHMATFWARDHGLKAYPVRLRRHSVYPVITRKEPSAAGSAHRLSQYWRDASQRGNGHADDPNTKCLFFKVDLVQRNDSEFDINASFIRSWRWNQGQMFDFPLGEAARRNDVTIDTIR